MVDYRSLNRITKRKNARISRTDEVFDHIRNGKFFSKIGLKNGFHQFKMEAEEH